MNGQSTQGFTISGTVKCSTGCAAVGLTDGSPINSAFQISASMTMAADPVSCQADPSLPLAPFIQASFPASANGQYQLQGLQAGLYLLTASAAGYQAVNFSPNATVCAGHSLVNIDASMTPSKPVPEFNGTFIVFFLSFAALCILERRRIKR